MKLVRSECLTWSRVALSGLDTRFQVDFNFWFCLRMLVSLYSGLLITFINTVQSLGRTLLSIKQPTEES